MLPAKPEGKAQLDAYAERHGQDTASALDEVLANYLEWEQQDYQESVEAIRKDCEDVTAGQTRPASEFLEQLRAEHGFPR
jgi:wobble nucleotide-excising tRNase